MAEPIRNKPKVAPTPQNTPASVSTLQAQTPHSRAAMESIRESGSDPAALLNIIQSRLGDLSGLTSGYIEALPKAVKDRVAALKGIRARQAQIEGDYHREVLALEKKYQQKQQPLYDERRRVIAGEATLKPEDIEAGEAAFEEEKEMFDGPEESDEDEDEEDEDEEQEKKEPAEDASSEEDDGSNIIGVPNFWLTALRNVPHLTEMITDRDSDVLASLVDVRLLYMDKPGFKLEFEFADNAYFTNRVLTKTYFYHEQIGLSGDFMFDHATGTDVKWVSPEMNVTVRVEKRKQRNKHTKATRTIEKTLPENSFFSFFSPPKIPDPEDEEVEDEYAQSLHAELELDFELGEFFKEKLVPRAVDWFTGRALDYEGLGAEEGEDDEEDDEEEYDEDEDEDANPEDLKKDVPENCKQQ